MEDDIYRGQIEGSVESRFGTRYAHDGEIRIGRNAQLTLLVSNSVLPFSIGAFYTYVLALYMGDNKINKSLFVT